MKRVLKPPVWGDERQDSEPVSAPDQGSEGEMIRRQWLRRQKHQTDREGAKTDEQGPAFVQLLSTAAGI